MFRCHDGNASIIVSPDSDASGVLRITEDFC
jgi:hypothetical protein